MCDVNRSIPYVFFGTGGAPTPALGTPGESLFCGTCASVVVGMPELMRNIIRKRQFIRLIIKNSIAVIPVRRLSFNTILFADKGARWERKSQQNNRLNSTTNRSLAPPRIFGDYWLLHALDRTTSHQLAEKGSRKEITEQTEQTEQTENHENF